MPLTMRLPQTEFFARVGRGCAIVLVVAAAGCSHPKSDGAAPTPSKAAAESNDKDITQSPNMPIEQYLASRSAGVELGHAADGSLTVRIRGGSSSTYGNNAPLYIVDGVPFTPSVDGGLSGLNPYDIASIKALKNAADISMYGVRGANGVIIIKTKKAN